jgi:uncharacterized membrane protein HdeD (DUF308 family)
MAVENLTEDIKKRSTWSIVMGVLTALLGIFLIAYPLVTATVTTILLGWVLIFVGIAQFIFAFHSQSVGAFFLKVLMGLAYGIIGIALAFFPFHGVAALTVFVGTLFLIHGALAVVAAFQMKPADGWGWFLFDGACSLLLGFLILAHWPSSSLWALGTLVGVAVLMSGISRIMLASRIRRGVGVIDSTVRRAA